MTLNTVTLMWDLSDLVESGVSATLSITPTAQMSDTTDHILIPPVPRSVTFSGGTGQLAGIVANDNSAIQPSGTGYLISVVSSAGQVIVPQFQTQILYSNGAVQWLDALATVPVVTTSYQYLPLPSGTAVAGQGPVASGSGEMSAWGPYSGMYLCAPSVYAPASQTPLTVTGTAWQAFSSASASTNSFTAPPSGKVLVTATFVLEEGTTGQAAWISVAQHGTTTPAAYAWSTSATTSPIPQTATFEVTGLTPGTSYQLDLIGACGTAGDTVTIAAYGSMTVSTTRGGPVIITVEAV